MFEPLPAQMRFPDAERQVLEFWQKHDIFGKSLEIRRGAPRFVFYEGPPTANGLPHPGHCLTRAIKDLFPRYKTMCGFLVERKAGWDTHGLPVEVEVCKELGIHTKEEIEAYGVAKFVERCIESVFRYTREWEEMTRRLGFWVNLEEAYVTYHQGYVESVWWSLKTLFERGLLYQGHKIVWWWCQGGTALSAGEVGEGYRTVDDPSVYIRFPLVREAVSRQPSAVSQNAPADVAPAPRGRRFPHDDLPADARVSLLVWTTTPWTLISNHFAAVGADIDYSLVHDQTTNEYLYVATALVHTTAEKVKHKLETVATCKGTDLIGLRYVPPFDCYYKQVPTSEMSAATPSSPQGPLGYEVWPVPPMRPLGEVTAQLSGQQGEDYIGWRILPADFVTLDTGTGIVHQAPAYGEVDFNLLQEERQRFADLDAVPLLNAVAPDGTFTAEAPKKYRGPWVKDCDKEIIRELTDRRILYHQEMYRHEYPFCPRAEDDPLIQYARKSWFVRTSQFRDDFLANNAAIHWLPEHILEGRFGDFLRNNVDWALSRERYWGTPLPIWVCEETGKMEAIGSYAELLAKSGVQGTDVWEDAKRANPNLPDHLRVHKPYIDAITYDSPFAPGGAGVPPARMHRVPEVIDCWWDAGSMPFAQWGFPHTSDSVRTFIERFPADFISEAIDQTRGWFYGLLAISTLLFSYAAVRKVPQALRGRFAEEMKAEGIHREEREEMLRAIVDRDLPDDVKSRLDELLGLSEAERAAMRRDVSGTADVTVALLDRYEIADDPATYEKRDVYPIPYRTCIVLGHVMGEDGLKMSKRTKNYKEPSYIFDTYGADAMRWYFFSAQAPWTSVRFQEANIRDAQREFLVRLYNVFSFFNIYANIDGFVAHPTNGSPWRPTAQRGELDRWIISELQRTVRAVREDLDRFENYPAAGRINGFVDALSNWYVRRSRDRFWQHDKTQDKWDAYHTLYGVLWTLSQLIAPFTPFFAEMMYQNLLGTEGRKSDGATERRSDGGTKGEEDMGSASSPRSHVPTLPPLSVHLCDYPVADEALIDEDLAQEMDLVRDIVSLGRAARTAAKLRVRQPLALAEIIVARPEHTPWLETHTGLIAEELNIKRVEFTSEADHYVTYQVKPDFKAIGPKFGPLAPKIAAALAKVDAAEARRSLAASAELTVTVEGQPVRLTDADVQVRLEARPGWSAAHGRAGVVVVKTELSPELKDEGLVRELIHHVQALRKEQNLPYEARVALYLEGPEPFLQVVRRFGATIERECLAQRIEYGPAPGGKRQTVKIESHEVRLAITAL